MDLKICEINFTVEHPTHPPAWIMSLNMHFFLTLPLIYFYENSFIYEKRCNLSHMKVKTGVKKI